MIKPAIRRICSLLLLLASSAGEPTLAAIPGPRQRALLVGISRYPPATGWKSLHTETDLELLRAALVRHGFTTEGIRELRDAEATREGILRALREHLIEPARQGDVVVFHYSGHGQRLTDDDLRPDELDGYDEALVPYDAPRASPIPEKNRAEGTGDPKEDPGKKHLRDDVLHVELQTLRQKVGPSGNVVVFLDTCFSGTATRGRVRRRGAEPLGAPRAGEQRQADAGGGFDDVESANREPSDLAPHVVFSASRHDSPAYETRTSDGRLVGSLSLALSEALLGSRNLRTYRDLFEEVRWRMARQSNVPQAEGELDTELWSGRWVRQAPFAEAVEVRDGYLTVEPGTLVGLLPGARIEVHRPGTAVPSAATRLIAGTVERSEPLTATVAFEETRTALAAFVSGRIFVTHYSFGELNLGVTLRGFDATGQQRIEEAFGRMLAITPDGDDIVVTRQPTGGAEVTLADTGEVVFAVASAETPEGTQCLAGRLEDLARNRYLRGMELHSPRLGVSLEVVPVRLSRCKDPGNPWIDSCQLEEIDRRWFVSRGQELELPVGTYFKLRVYPGRESGYIAVLDLMPDGRIDLLWPLPGTADPTPLDKRKAFELPALYRTIEPFGVDVFLLVATERFVDFTPFVTSQRCEEARRGSSCGGLGPFEPACRNLASVSHRRARAVFDPGEAGTDSVHIRVTAN